MRTHVKTEYETSRRAISFFVVLILCRAVPCRAVPGWCGDRRLPGRCETPGSNRTRSICTCAGGSSGHQGPVCNSSRNTLNVSEAFSKCDMCFGMTWKAWRGYGGGMGEGGWEGGGYTPRFSTATFDGGWGGETPMDRTRVVVGKLVSFIEMSAAQVHFYPKNVLAPQK